MRDTASIGFVTAAAAFYGWVLTRCGGSNAIAEFLAGVTTNPAIFMLIVNIALLIIGCFMESIAAILVFGPVLLSAATAMGIDPLYFGLVMVLNLMIGLTTRRSAYACLSLRIPRKSVFSAWLKRCCRSTFRCLAC